MPVGNFFIYLKDNGPNYKEKFLKSSLGTQEGTMVLDLFDKNCYFLKSYSYDNFKYGKIKFIDAEGYLYTNIGPEEIIPSVTKLSLSFRKNSIKIFNNFNML